MYKTKKEVDAYVRSELSKILSLTERHLYYFTIAKLYYEINEFADAEEYLCSYLSFKEDNDQAHKLLGQCYQHLKKPDKALQSFQRSLQLNPKQSDVLAEVCQLLLEDKNLNTNKAKYWSELAESEKVQHEAVFSLRLKLMNKENLGTNQVEELIQKEIAARPNDVQLRVRLVRNYVEKNQILDAFKYVQQLEMSQKDEFVTSGEWYNVVWLVLNKYEQMPNTKKNWDFWLLLAICLERQVQISFSLPSKPTVLGGGMTESENLLFNLDQYLFKISQLSDKFCVQKELVELFLDHYRGQLLLHATVLIFKRARFHKSQWKETTRNVLPLLLLAYQIAASSNREPWMNHCDKQIKQLIILWQREGSFRCAQVGRTLLSCVDDNGVGKENAHNINNLLGSQSSGLWQSNDELLNQVRQTCSDRQWRRNIFALLFCKSDQKIKEQSSLFAMSQKLSEPIYEMPSNTDVECYEDAVQYLRPQSLQHMVYLCLGKENLAYVRAKYFSGLNYSTQNLSFCEAESLNQLDLDSFLYAATIQAKKALEVDSSVLGKPKLLPFVNIQNMLCTKEQSQWWNAAYIVYKNLSSGNDLAELRANLQYGIEAVRGINGLKLDMTIAFKLGQIFVARAQHNVKPIEKAYLEARAESIYKYALNMMKMPNEGVLQPFRKYFKYVKSHTPTAERALVSAAEDAVSHLATRYFKRSEYEDLIAELSGIQLPFATYVQAVAYHKLCEASKTPKKRKQQYINHASECLNQTLALLKSSAHANSNHLLSSLIHSEIKRLQQISARYLNESNTNFSPINGHNNSIMPPLSMSNTNPSRRDTSSTTAILSSHNQEIETPVKQIVNALKIFKDEIINNFKSELQNITREICTLKDKISSSEEAMRKNTSWNDDPYQKRQQTSPPPYMGASQGRNNDESITNRFDMISSSPFMSQQQCIQAMLPPANVVTTNTVPLPNSNAANDFADVRFKLPETAKQFQGAFKKAQKDTEDKQSAMPGKNAEKPKVASTPVTNAATPFALTKSTTTNFTTSTPAPKNDDISGPQAKPIFGQPTFAAATTTSSNTANASKPLFSGLNLSTKISTSNDNSDKTTTVTTTSASMKNDAVESKPTKGFGDAFKSKAGSWSCNACYISNNADQLYCMACDTPKDNTVPKKEVTSNILAPSSNTKFSLGFSVASSLSTTSVASQSQSSTVKPSFGFITPTTASTSFSSELNEKISSTKPPAAGGFGDAFKPKAGSWTCQGCYLNNSGDAQYCKSCDAPKDDTVPKKDANTNILALSNPAQKFSFGFGSAATAVTSSDNSVKPVVGGFSFGAQPVATTESAKSFTFTPPSATSTTLNISSTPATAHSNASLGKATFNFNLSTKAIESPILAGGESTPNAFSLDKKEFSFTLKPKSPGKAGKSPMKSGGGDVDGVVEDDGDAEYHEEEENNTYFTPVIPLPDKIEVKTGEEDEELLYVHRAKLYRFVDGEWKERGLGNVKILRHKETKKLRVVMRREQILKICLNHVLNEDVDYKRKDDKSWLFVVNDFSEGSVKLEKFSLRFKTKEVAEAFMDAVKKALDRTAEVIESPANTTIATPTSSQPATSTIALSEEDKKTADKLKLPHEFFTVDSSCPGCRGCDPDKFVFADVNECFVNSEDANNQLDIMELPALTLSKSTINRTLLKQSALSPATVKSETAGRNENIFSGFGGANSTAFATPTVTASTTTEKPVNTTFSFIAALNNTSKSCGDIKHFEPGASASAGGSLFGGAKDSKFTFGEKPATFGGAAAAPNSSSKYSTSSADTATKSVVLYPVDDTVPKNVVNTNTLAPSIPTEKFYFGATTFPRPSTTSTTLNVSSIPKKVIFSLSARLFHVKDMMWKDPSIGDITILKCNDGTSRIVIRSDQSLNICANHKITHELKLTVPTNDTKGFVWTANDFAEGSLQLKRFYVRFKLPTIAQRFQTAFKKAQKEAKDIQSAMSANNVEKSKVTSPSNTGTPFALTKSTATNLVTSTIAPKNGYSLESQREKVFGKREVMTTTAAPLANFTFKNWNKPSGISSTPNRTISSTVASETGDAISSTFESISAQFAKNLKEIPREAKIRKSNIKRELYTLTATNFVTSTLAQKVLENSIFAATATEPLITSSTSKSLFSDLKISTKISSLNDDTVTATNFVTSTLAPKNQYCFGYQAQKVLEKSIFAATATAKSSSNASQSLDKTSTIFGDLSKTATASLDFASLARASTNTNLTLNSNEKSAFIGLTNQNDFSSFGKPLKELDSLDKNSSASKRNESQKNIDGGDEAAGHSNDENCNPHYVPVIELPNKVMFSTPEEEETKLFGERAFLFRWNATNKEIKESGVGELKILLNPVKRYYRLVMRCVEIHKIVLNHGINADFHFDNMNNNPKSFVWETTNYAESNEGELEKLAVRFCKLEIAEAFSNKLKECIDNCKEGERAN